MTSAKVGDNVTSTLTTFCGGCHRCLAEQGVQVYPRPGDWPPMDGGFAEFVKLPETSLIPVPRRRRPGEASVFACPMGVALQAVRDVGEVQAGETVLVTGAGGGLGFTQPR